MTGSSIWRFVAILLVVAAGALIVIAVGRQLTPEPAPLTSAAGLESALRSLNRAFHGQTIDALALNAVLDVPEGGLRIRAELQVTSQESGRRQFTFLLNPGFSITAVEIRGRPARFHWSRGELTVSAAEPVNTGETVVIAIEYEGRADGQTLRAPIRSEVECILPALAFWHPFDLRSFFTADLTITLPDGWTVAAPSNATTASDDDGFVTVTWQEPRPVFGVPLVAGQFASHSRYRGASLTTLHVLDGLSSEDGGLLDRASRAYRALTDVLGADGFEHLHVVVSPTASTSFYAGGSIVVVPMAEVGLSPAGPDIFMSIARPAARIWWEGTVSARWVADPPEGGAWLTTGMAEYSAALALRDEFGRQAFLRYLEQTPSPQATLEPLKTLGMPASVHQEPYGPGPLLARMLAGYAGEARFLDGVRSFLGVHRYGFVSLTSFRQEIELAAAIPLGEFFHAWFDRPAQFDYAIEDVEELTGGGVAVTIANRGDTPLMGQLAVAIQSSEGMTVHRIEAGARGGRFLLPATGRVFTVALDPLFETPETIRANTFWPRRTWPRGVTASVRGKVAWWVVRDWNSAAPAEIGILEPDGRTVRKIRTARRPVDGPYWSPDGTRLAWTRPIMNGGTMLHLVGESLDVEIRMPEGGRLAGWMNNEKVAVVHSGATSRWSVFHIEGSQTATWNAPPPLALPALHPERPLLAYVAEATHQLVILDITTGKHTVLASETRPTGPVGWCVDGRCVYYFGLGDGLQRLSVTDTPASPETVVSLRYAVSDGQFAPDQRHVAWRDSAGFLRVTALDGLRTRHVPIQGEIVDWSWEGPDALICMTVDVRPELPMRIHGEYALWRVPLDGLEPQELAVPIAGR